MAAMEGEGRKGGGREVWRRREKGGRRVGKGRDGINETGGKERGRGEKYVYGREGGGRRRKGEKGCSL